MNCVDRDKSAALMKDCLSVPCMDDGGKACGRQDFTQLLVSSFSFTWKKGEKLKNLFLLLYTHATVFSSEIHIS